MYSTPTDLNYIHVRIPLVSANTRPHQQHWLQRETERERERALASDGIHTTIDGITLTVGCQKIMAANTQRAAYTFYKALQLHRQKHSSLSLKRDRDGVHPSASELHVQENH